MFKEKMNATGKVHVVLTDKNGNIKQEFETNNLVVDDGLDHIASRLNSTPTAMSHMALGSDNTAAASSDSALGTELARVTFDSDNVTNNAIAYVATFSAGTATGSISEAGIFNASSAGTMLCRTVFSVVNKAASDVLTVTWTVTIA
jgi:hypothetical protein